MVLASGIRRLRLLGAVCIGLMAFAIAAQPAQADTRVVKGGESRLQVNLTNFYTLLADGMWMDPIAPAQIEWATGTAIFPAGSVGVADSVLKTATVPHNGGLRITKASINQSIDATNVTLACVPVVGCRVLNTANNLLPNELAELRDVTFTDNGSGTVTIRGVAHIGPVTALVLNTLFQSKAFVSGMQLGEWTSTLRY